MGNYLRSPELVFLENELNKKINILNEKDIEYQADIELLQVNIDTVNENISEINENISEIHENIEPIINNTNQINKVWGTNENGDPYWKNAAKVEGTKLIL